MLERLKRYYLRLFRRHALSRHFRDRALADALRAPARSRGELPAEASRALSEFATLPTEALYARLRASPAGLAENDAARRRREFGANDLARDRPPPWWRHLFQCYRNPFNLLLTVLALMSWLTESVQGALVIAAMVVLSTGLRFFEEARSGRAADALKALVGTRASVLRAGGDEVSVAMRDLVPGEVVVLSAGDMVPADLRVLSAKDLFISQSALTGESLPVEKFPQATSAPASPFDLENLLFMGTSVVSGSAHALVIATGARTCFGAMAERVVQNTRPPTQFEVEVNHVSTLLIRFMLVMVPLVFLINLFTKGAWLEALLFSLAIAVGLTPEMLPMIVTSTLARGAVVLSRKKVIVKRLDAIRNFGAMNVLCTDKTGTLTQDRIFLERHIDAFGAPSDEVLSAAFLNSHYHTGLKSTLDDAVLAHAELHLSLDVAKNYAKVDEIPFDFSRKRMSVVVSERDHHHELICKGAIEEVLAVCAWVRQGADQLPLDEPTRERLRVVSDQLAGEGLRLVAVAMKEVPPEKQIYSARDECDLTLIGYVAFIDPPKESTAPALKALAAHGIEVKILTGDNARVTRTICREVGLPAHDVLLGADIDAMDDPALALAVRHTNVFAKLSPAQKERIVRVLREAGNVVGFLGDGINDAPALHAADIGISVDSAVDIAKEAADIILLEKSLLVLDEGVVEGRRTFANMSKYIRLTASSNFGNVFSVLLASAFLPFLPMLPVQLLVQNLLYDLCQIAIPFDTVDAKSLLRPQHWRADELARFMLWFGPVSSLFDLITFAMLWFVFAANTVAAQSLFQSGWFVEGLMSQILIVHVIRTRALPFVESRAGWPLMVMSLVALAMAVFLPMGPLAHYFGMQPLPGLFFVFLAGILLLYLASAQTLKKAYARRHGWR